MNGSLPGEDAGVDHWIPWGHRRPNGSGGGLQKACRNPQYRGNSSLRWVQFPSPAPNRVFGSTTLWRYSGRASGLADFLYARRERSATSGQPQVFQLHHPVCNEDQLGGSGRSPLRLRHWSSRNIHIMRFLKSHPFPNQCCSRKRFYACSGQGAP